ncbi:MAG: glycosyltransferase family 39 protein, partial [Anaerolineae bacterium]|nr:glycosyltransferase family 39 protein [Anaerolineae bacterium]
MKLLTKWIQHLIASNWVLRLLMVLVIITMTVSTFQFNIGKNEGLDEGSLWALLGALMLLLMLLLVWNRPNSETIESTPPPTTKIHTRTRWVAVLLGIYALAILAEISGKVFKIRGLLSVSSHVQFALWVAGICLLAYGFAGMRYIWGEKQTQSGKIKKIRIAIHEKTFRQHLTSIPHIEIMMLGAVVIFATIVRAIQLETLVRLWIDEIHFSNPVLHFNTSTKIDLLIPFSSVAAFPYIFPYMQWHFVEFFGWNLVGLRMFSVFLGVANVIALYLLVRELFNRRVAIMAAIALAVLPVHIQFSRIALNNIADPLFGTLTFYFIARGFNRPHQIRGNFAWAGAMLGLTQYFYEGGRFLYPVLTLSWLGLLGGWAYVRHIRPMITPALFNKTKRQAIIQKLSVMNPIPIIRAGVILWVVAVCVGAPVYYTLIARNQDLASRLDSAGVTEKTIAEFDGAEGVIKHVIRRMTESMMIHMAIPEAQLYYGGDAPFILLDIAPYFLIGAFFAIWLALLGGIFDAKSVIGATLMVMWVGITWLGNVFLQESRISARYVVEFPALATFIGLGAVCIAENLHLKNIKRTNFLLIIIACHLMTSQTVYYFDYHIRLFNQQFRDDRGRNYDIEDALYRSVGFPNGTRVHIIDHPTMYSPD